MSRNEEDRRRPRTPLEVLDQTWMSFEESHQRVSNELAERGVSFEARVLLEEDVMNMYHQLEPRAEQAAEIWQEFRMDQIPQRCARHVGVTEATETKFGTTSGGGEPIIQHATVDELLFWSQGIRRCLDELGFHLRGPSESGGGSLRTVDIENARFGNLGDFAETEFAQALIEDIEGVRDGGAIIVVDAEDARTGVGKTSAAVAFAKFTANLFGYDLREDDLVLSGEQYLGLYDEQPGEEQVSVAVWDEAVGAGSGDARRAMANQNVELGQAWQIMRQQKVITFVTLPDWGDLDSRLQKFADYRLWCRRDIGQVQAYEVGTEFNSGNLRTRGLGPGDGAEPIQFPDMAEIEDPHYMALKQKKTELIESGTLDADSLHDDPDETTEEDDSPDLAEIADKVVEDVEEYTSVHGGNGTKYIDRDLIEMFHDISRRDAKKVKSLVEKRGVEI